MENKKVWFITGASKGLGLSLTKRLLGQGQIVAATSRNLNELVEAIGPKSENFLPLQMDLTTEDCVGEAINITYKTFGRFDVVVNNAGYGIAGTIEELTDEETRSNFDVNVFGTLNVIRSVMPYLRAQQSGHIINISSIAGIAPDCGFAIYSATKYSVIGLSDVLAQDVKEFGINVTAVAPGAFRTNFLTPESLAMAKRPIEAYQQVRNVHTRYLEMDGKQAGDPEKAIDAIIEITTQENPPLYLLLGNDAYDRAMSKLDYLEKEFRLNEELTRSMAYQG